MRGYRVVVREPDGKTFWYATWDYRNRGREELLSEEDAYVKRVYGPEYCAVEIGDIETSPRF